LCRVAHQGLFVSQRRAGVQIEVSTEVKTDASLYLQNHPSIQSQEGELDIKFCPKNAKRRARSSRFVRTTSMPSRVLSSSVVIMRSGSNDVRVVSH
ncbi:hypothetical protein CERSUDRAFT_118546, partial [Gelatoporia subvermispora B]